MAVESKIIVSAEDRTRAAFASVDRNLGSLSGTVKKFSGIFAGVLGAGSLAHFIKSQIDAADALNDLSKRLNISVENLAGFKFAAEQSGTSLESLSTAFKKLQVNLVAAETNRELAQTFRILGVSAKDPTQAMFQMADAFKSLGDRPERTAAAIKLMGRAGDEAIPALAAGSEELRKMMTRGQELSGVTAANAKLADEFNDKLTELKTAAGGVGLAIGTELIPWLLKLTQEMESAIRVSGSFSASLKNAAFLNFGSRFSGITDDVAALQKELEKGILTPNAREAVRAQIKFLKEQQREVALALNAGGDQGREGLNRTAVSGGAGSADAKAQALRLAADFDELSKKLTQIQTVEQDAQTKLASKYVQDYQTLNRARAASVIQTDRQLGIERLALATQYEQAIAELAAKETGDNKLGERIAAEKILRQQELESRLLSVQDSLKTEEQLENERHAKRIATLYEANQTRLQIDEQGNAQQLLGDAEFLRSRELLEQQHQDNLNRIKLGYRKLDLNSAGYFFGQMANLMQTNSKTLFEIGKKAAIAETIIETHKAAMGAYAALAKIPIVGPALGVAAAAAAIAYGASRVQAINSQSFGAGGSIGGGSAVPTYSASPNTGLPELPENTPEGRTPLTVNITVNGHVLDVQQLTDDYLIPAIRDAVDNRDVTIIGNNSRQAANLLA